MRYRLSPRATTFAVAAALAAFALRLTPPAAPHGPTLGADADSADLADLGWTAVTPTPASASSAGSRTDTVVVGGVIQSTLFGAISAAARDLLPPDGREKLTYRLADIFEYRVDLSRELQRGDSFKVLVVRSAAPDGSTRVSDVLAARLALSGNTVEAVKFASGSGRGEYFDGEGKSLRLAFLRAPLSFRRISSVFGMRKHPILGIWRNHTGTDYAASSGTPVRSVGDGRVVFAGWKGGYGRVLEIRHRNGYVSRYGHLQNFARGLRPGQTVSIGQTVAFVGTSGLSTAPHLHFEILVGGVQRDPRAALRAKTNFSVSGGQRVAFEHTRATLLAALDRVTGATYASHSELAPRALGAE